MKKCNCDLCKRGKKFEKILGKFKEFVILDKDIKWLEDLYCHLMDVEAELDWYKNNDLMMNEIIIDPGDWVWITGSQEEDSVD